MAPPPCRSSRMRPPCWCPPRSFREPIQRRCALRRPQGRGADRGGGRREARAADLQQARRTGSQCAVPAVL